jgi:PAS domain S-box-containing protein
MVLPATRDDARDEMRPLEEIRERLERVSDPVALLAGIFAHAPFGLQIYDASGRCLLVNQAFRDLFGSEPPPDYNILKDEIAERNGVLDLIHRAFAGETVAIGPMWYDPRELKQITVEQGNRVAITSTFFPLFDAAGRVGHVAILFKDLTTEITAREQAEQERDLLRAIFQQSGDGIIVCDEQGVIRGFNPEAQRQHGVEGQAVPPAQWAATYGLRDLQGRPLPQADIPLYRALKGERVENARWVVRRADGTDRTLTGTALPLEHADGTPAGAVVTTRDETERLALEEDLRHESVRNQRLYEEAQELHRAKDEFLATVSHELRTPLQAILGWARLLQETDEEPARRRHGLATIERNAKIQAQLVEDILDASRLVAGKMNVQWQPVDLTGVVRSLVDGFLPTATAKGVTLSADLPHEPVMVTGDADRLQQVAWNVVANALKFTPAGERVEVTLRAEDDQAVLKVADTGVGIPTDFLPYVFDRFRQADSSTTRAHGGLGLGLALVRHLVEMHGGTVEAESLGPGRGASFTVRLRLYTGAVPAGAETSRPVQARHDPGPARLARVGVLVVDDEEDTRDLLATALGHEGAEVQAVASAPEALRALRERRPDVLVCDIGMPDVDGYALLSQVRALSPEEGGLVPALALTAYARPDDRRRALSAGYQVHLTKPVDPDELISAVARMAGWHRPGGKP